MERLLPRDPRKEEELRKGKLSREFLEPLWRKMVQRDAEFERAQRYEAARDRVRRDYIDTPYFPELFTRALRLGNQGVIDAIKEAVTVREEQRALRQDAQVLAGIQPDPEGAFFGDQGLYLRGDPRAAFPEAVQRIIEAKQREHQMGPAISAMMETATARRRT